MSRVKFGATRARGGTYDQPMIEREQVEHVEKISELDLEGVEPTTHVIALENVLRPDKSRPSWSRDEVLERAPDPAGGSFRVPSPQA